MHADSRKSAMRGNYKLFLPHFYLFEKKPIYTKKLKWLHCKKSAISRNYFSTFFIYFWEKSMEKENSDKWLHCRKSAISRNYFSTFFMYFWEKSMEKENSDKWLHCRKSAIKEKQWIVCYLASTLISRRSIMHHAAEKQMIKETYL